jgi:serine/threonine protein kinase
LATKDAVDLVSKMLVVDHNERISTDDALNHPFLK